MRKRERETALKKLEILSLLNFFSEKNFLNVCLFCSFFSLGLVVLSVFFCKSFVQQTNDFKAARFQMKVVVSRFVEKKWRCVSLPNV